MKRVLQKEFLNWLKESLGFSMCPTETVEDGMFQGTIPSGRKVAFFYHSSCLCLFYGQRLKDDPKKDQENEDFLKVRRSLFSLFGITATEDVPKNNNALLNEIFGMDPIILAWIEIEHLFYN